MTELLAELHAAGIAYCHWKSNEHLRAAVTGETDLDLLVERGAAARLPSILADAGFKRFISPPGRGYIGIEDYLALDSRSGVLVHVHLHYQLTVGEDHLKGYHLPWERVVLSTRALDRELGIQVADAHVEFVLLAVRAALKLRARDIVRGVFGASCVGGGILRELRWLAARVEPDRLLEVGRRLVGEKAARMLPTLAVIRMPAHQLMAFRRAVEPPLRSYRTYGGIEGRLQRWRRELSVLWGRAGRRFLRAGRVPNRRVLPQSGIVVALVGADGSGKSTVGAEVVRWLGRKVDVLPLYFGSGSGPASLLRWPLTRYRALRRSVVARQGGAPPPTSADEGRKKGWSALAGVLSAGLVAREKRTRLEQARRARNRGAIVLCDRYPQSQFMGFNDGPRFSHWLEHRSRILRRLARWEAAIYRSAALYPPDLVIKLLTAPEVAWRRKPERPLEALVPRVEAIRALRFPHATRVVEVDAAQPIERVLLDVKRTIWESL